MKTSRFYTAAAPALITALLTTASGNAFAQSSDTSSRIARLEQEIAILKRTNEVNEEIAASKAEKTPSFELGRNGFLVTSPDKEYSLRLRGYAQFDGRFFTNDENKDDVDTFLARRLRPIIEAKVGNDLSFRFMPDFGGGNVKLFDGYGEYSFAKEANVRIGKFKPPVGLERLQSATDLAFIERGLANNFAPSRDFGVQLHGELIPDTLEYQIGVFNGTEDLGTGDSDTDDNKDYAARVFAKPFSQTDYAALKGLGFGVGGSYGKQEGSATNLMLPDYRTPGQARFFRYRTGTLPGDNTYADGTHWRLYPQAYWYYGSFGFMGEYAISNQDVTRGTTSGSLKHDAWQLQASYVLTGEDASYKGVRPEKAFNPHKGTWGALEAVARYGELDIDDEAFPIFADPTRAATKATSVGGGLNWYLNDNVRLSGDYESTGFDGGAAAGADRERENVVLTRAQFKF